MIAGTTLAAAGLLWSTGAGGFRTEGLDAVVPLGLTALVLGEDVGWRGLLMTRLAEVAGPRTAAFRRFFPLVRSADGGTGAGRR